MSGRRPAGAPGYGREAALDPDAERQRLGELGGRLRYWHPPPARARWLAACLLRCCRILVCLIEH
jgi:hypothetical protein